MKKIKLNKIASCLLLVCLLFTLVVPVSQNVQAAEVPGNMVINPGFEMPLVDGKIPGWNFYYGSSGVPGTGITSGISNTASSEGTNSLFISDTGSASVVAYSDAINIDPSKKYKMTAKLNNKTNSVTLLVRFYTSPDGYSTGALTGDVRATLDTTISQWTEYIVDINTIPAGALYAKILLYTSGSSKGAANMDEVSFTEASDTPTVPEITYNIENLGSTIHTIKNHRAVFGKDQNGDLMAYSTLVGVPANLVITDVKTGKIVAQLPIEDTVNSTLYTTQMCRGIVAMPDGTVYLNGTPSIMFKYVPGTGKVQFASTSPGSQTFDMKMGPDGILVGGTYNKSEAFEFDTKTNEMKSLGRMSDTESYSYSVAYDAKRNDYYFGIGSHGHLIKFDRDTGVKTEIPLFEEFAPQVQILYDMTIVGDKLFMRYTSMQQTVVYDLETGQYESSYARITSRHLSEKEPDSNRIYYTISKILGYYDLDKKEFISLGIYIDGDPVGFTFAELNEPDYPGTSLVAFTEEGRLFKYNPQTGNNSCIIVPIAGAPTTLQTVEKGYDGRINTSGYLNGGNAILDILTGDRSEFTNETRGLGQGLPQTDRIYTYKDKIYYTTYPENMIWEFDPNKPWHRDDTEASNPKMVYSGYHYGEQDRGIGGVMIEDQAKLVVGSVPKYGKLGGALSVYDINTGTGQTFYNIIDKQSITAVTYKDGLIYAGTSIWGGMGQPAETTEAKLFIWDMATNEKIFEIVPVPGKNTITELKVGPDGNIWGVVEGTLFIFDPVSRKVIFTKEIGTVSYTTAVWRDAQLQIGTDGNVYGVLNKDFFKIDAVTKEYTSIRNNGKRNWLAQDDFGNFYLTEETELLKLTIPELVVKPTGAALSVENPTVARDEDLNISITGLLEKGRTINMLEKRSPQLFSSDTNVLAPENGKLVPKNFGQAEVWAIVNINGTSFTTNHVTITVGKSTNASLKEIKVNGRAIQSVSQSVYDYIAEVPYSERNISPVVEAVASSVYAKTAVTQAESLPGKAFIEVTSESGDVKRLYSVQINIAAPEIASIQPVNVATDVGIAPVLPSVVTAVYEDNSQKALTVTWETIAPEKYAVPGSFTVQGAVYETSIPAIANVTVGSIVPEIVSIQPVNVTTKVGVTPVLPSVVTAVYGDNSQKELGVTWETIAPEKYAVPGSFTVLGAVYETAIPAIANVIVGSNEPEIVSIQPVNVTTKVGVVPVLPSVVTAVYGDNSQKVLAVIWETIAPVKYAATGSFTVQGVVYGTSIPAIANITVKKKSSTDGATNPPVIPTPTPTPTPSPIVGQSITIEAKVDSAGTATAQIKAEDMLAAINNTQTNEIDIHVKSADGAQKVNVNIPAGQISVADDKQIKRINIDTGLATVSIDPDTFKKILDDKSSNVELSIAKVDTATLSDAIKNKVGSSMVYDFNLSVDGKKISSFRGNEVTVSVNYQLKAGENPNKVVVYYIDDNGNLEVVKNCRYKPVTGKVEFKAKHFSKYAAAYSDISFKDLGNVAWAKEDIEILAAKGIINGYGDGSFKPEDKIKRSEYIKLLMQAFDLADSSAKSTLKDVKEGEWYYSSISAAQKLGIVKGKADGSFGIDDEISREDMAVMAYRVAQVLNQKLDKNAAPIEFKDKQKISGYAAEAVAVMQQAGIINGTGNGSFEPELAATRAEAAVIVHKIFDQFNE